MTALPDCKNAHVFLSTCVALYVCTKSFGDCKEIDLTQHGKALGQTDGKTSY